VSALSDALAVKLRALIFKKVGVFLIELYLKLSFFQAIALYTRILTLAPDEGGPGPPVL
jgi:hypothetical protein